MLTYFFTFVLILSSDVLSWMGIAVLFTLIILTRVLSASSASSKAAQTTEWGPIKPAIDVDLSLPEVSRLANRSSLPHGGRIVQLSHGMPHYILDGPTRRESSSVGSTYKEHGALVVLIHGLVGSSAYFEYLKDELVLMGCQVLIYDIYGRGHSDPCEGIPHTESLFASQRAELLYALGFGDEPIDLGGYSM